MSSVGWQTIGGMVRIKKFAYERIRWSLHDFRQRHFDLTPDHPFFISRIREKTRSEPQLFLLCPCVSERISKVPQPASEYPVFPLSMGSAGVDVKHDTYLRLYLGVIAPAEYLKPYRAQGSGAYQRLTGLAYSAMRAHHKLFSGAPFEFLLSKYRDPRAPFEQGEV